MARHSVIRPARSSGASETTEARHAATVKGGIDMRDTCSEQRLGFTAKPLNHLPSDVWLVVFESNELAVMSARIALMKRTRLLTRFSRSSAGVEMGKVHL